jgi:hypothetical protein
MTTTIDKDLFGVPYTEQAARPTPPAIYASKRMMQTREKLIGVSGKTLAARTMRTVASVRAQVSGIGAAFEDVDNSVVGAAEDLLRQLDEFERTVRDSVEWLKLPPETR